MTITQFILQCIYFMLPAYFANMAPVIFRKRFKFLAKPLDLGRTYLGKRIFGDNKTLRGLVMGIIFAVVITFIQNLLKDNAFFYYLTLPGLDYSLWLPLGILMGFGAIIGDAAESFFKRRLNKKPGTPFVPFDQTDFVIGAIVFVNLVYIPKWYVFISVLVISFILHFLVNHTAFYLGIRKEKW